MNNAFYFRLRCHFFDRRAFKDIFKNGDELWVNSKPLLKTYFPSHSDDTKLERKHGILVSCWENGPSPNWKNRPKTRPKTRLGEKKYNLILFGKLRWSLFPIRKNTTVFEIPSGFSEPSTRLFKARDFHPHWYCCTIIFTFCKILFSKNWKKKHVCSSWTKLH